MQNKIFALVDCNNFYASCERVFDANLEGKPIAVLSNNDGCIIARSNEVKALGLPMGAPVYKWRDLIEKENIILFSANFPLYGDMSHRVMQVLNQMVPDMEIYSIDEAFLDLTNMRLKDITEYAREIRARVKQWTGIPVSIGIGSTKTLAKAANKLAKQNPRFDGVFNLTDKSVKETDEQLKQVKLPDIWGVGRKYSQMLPRYNINNAYDLKYADKAFIKKQMTVAGERTLLELNGISCIPMQKVPLPKKAIACTRSFGKYQTTLAELEQAVAYFTRKVGEHLREQSSKTTYLQVFVLTNMHRQDHPQYHNSIIIKLQKPSDFTPLLLQATLAGLKKIFKPNYYYKKAGVLAIGIVPKDLIQYDFYESNIEARIKSETQLMNTVDKVNKTVGSDTLKYAIEGVSRGWWMQQTQKSQRYTTNWNEILKARLA